MHLIILLQQSESAIYICKEIAENGGLLTEYRAFFVFAASILIFGILLL